MPDLTVKQIDAIEPGARRHEYPDGRIKGLYYVVQPSGARSWALRYRVNGTPRKYTLGSDAALGLGDARKAATKALGEIANGVDPGLERKARKEAEKRQRMSPSRFTRDIAALYLETNVEPNNRSARETRRMFDKRVLPAWGSRDIDRITKQDVIAELNRIMDDGQPSAANNFFSAVRRFFNWAIERDLIVESPCKGMKMPAPERSRDRILDDGEILLFWRACAEEGYPFGTLGRFLLLSGQRRNEAAGMTWSELKLEQGPWTIPANRTKNGVAHQLPLSEAMLAELNSIPRIGSKPRFVFTTTGDTHSSGFSKAKRRIKKRMESLVVERGGESPTNWRLHDLRRTAASGMARLGTPIHVIEAVLNHRSGSIGGVAGIYNRYEYAAEKLEALQRWGQFVTRLSEDQLS